MIHRLHLQDCFVHKDEVFEFGKGLTAITGRNGTGKSLVLEMIRFALFGAAALRGSIKDLKGSKVTLDFDVNCVGYRVERNGSKCVLLRGDEPLAAGTKPVNAKIVEILGYGLAVFDTANAALQGEIEALGKMQPAERKAMVDSVVGLGVIDIIAEWCGAEATALSREVAAKREGLVAPVEPVKPADYESPVTLEPFRVLMSDLKTEKDRIGGWLQTEPKAPVEPVCTVAESAGDLQALVTARSELATVVTMLARQLQGLKRPTKTRAEIDVAKQQLVDQRRRDDAARTLSAFARPVLTAEQIQAGLTAHELYHRWERKQKLLGKGTHECPACHHQWPREAEALAEFVYVPDVVERPAITPTELNSQRAVLDRYTANAATIEAAERVSKALQGTVRPTFTERDIAAWEQALADDAKRTKLEQDRAAANATLAQIPDRSADLKTRNTYDAALTQYRTAKTSYDGWQAQKATKVARLAELQDVDAKLTAIHARITHCVAYDASAAAYTIAMARYDEIVASITAKAAAAEEYRKAKSALTILKSKVKQYLVPSLNRVASTLLSQMTGGARQAVHVDEDFDVTVDGQPLNTLEGSGKAIANLAIRIGLGRVLTNKVFSVFIGDEIDAAMDGDRAGWTAACLRNLTKHIGQIVLISHKRPEADRLIELDVR